MEEQLIKKLNGLISAIKLGTITPKDAGAGALFIKLKALNLGMYEELMAKYKITLDSLKK